MLWVLGASMQARAIQGLTSVSPIPVIPSSVWTKTTMSSCAEEVAEVSRSGTKRTWQSMAVIFMADPPRTGAAGSAASRMRGERAQSFP
jgi:hypothetical protein